MEARLLELRGELAKAVTAWKWFVDRYNQKQAEIVKSAESLILVGQAAERYYRASARGQELSDSLNAVINDIYEAAARVDPNCWQGLLLQGRLFLSGYNERLAVRETCSRSSRSTRWHQRCLSRSGTPIWSFTGWRRAGPKSNALATNPHFAPAFVLLADLNISDERFVDAKAAASRQSPKSRARRGIPGSAGGHLPFACRSGGGSKQPRLQAARE